MNPEEVDLLEERYEKCISGWFDNGPLRRGWVGLYDKSLINDRDFISYVIRTGRVRASLVKYFCDNGYYDLVREAVLLDYNRIGYASSEYQRDWKICFTALMSQMLIDDCVWRCSIAYFKCELPVSRLSINDWTTDLSKKVHVFPEEFLAISQIPNEDSPFYELSFMWFQIHGHSMLDLMVDEYFALYWEVSNYVEEWRGWFASWRERRKTKKAQLSEG